FFSSRRRHTRCLSDWSSDVCSSDLAVGDNVVATLTGTGKGHVLLIAHMDTVFPHGTVAQRPYRVVGDRGIGPGAGDDKAGIVTEIGRASCREGGWCSGVGAVVERRM